MVKSTKQTRVKEEKMSYPTEEEYRQAYQKWCQEHPEKTGAERFL